MKPPELEHRWWMHVIAAVWALVTALFAMHAFRELDAFWNGAICGASIAVVYVSIFRILQIALWAYKYKNDYD